MVDFPKNKLKYLGHGHTCKVCSTAGIKLYKRTKAGVIKDIYAGQLASARYRKMPPPSYSFSELSQWITANPLFSELYFNWVDSNYLKDFKPSVDRINDYVSYEFDNIQLMTWKENREKVHRDKVDGKNNKQSKVVHQFDLDGNLLNSYYSTAEASRRTGVDTKNIHYCVQKKPKYKTAGGYLWGATADAYLKRLQTKVRKS